MRNVWALLPPALRVFEPKLGSMLSKRYGYAIDFAGSVEATMAMPNTLYDHDFYRWANEQAALLRAGDVSSADIANIAEEIESMGRAERRELVSRLTVLLLHLLKWRVQPALRGPSWRATIRIQRRDLTDHLADNPSLKSVVAEAMVRAYGNAAIEAEAETGLSSSTFPVDCPWSFDQIMNETFWPEE